MSADAATIVPAVPSAYDLYLDRFLGSLLGGAIADAMGWITEFRASWQELDKRGVTHVDDYVSWVKPTGGRFHTYYDYISKGEYSDDTQLTLCTARSILADGNFDSARFVEELRAWLDYARGGGAAVTAASRNLRSKKSVRWNSNFYKSAGRNRYQGYFEAGGNGACMRVVPHALANLHNPERAYLGCWKNAIITHGHPRAIVGAVAMSEAVRLIASTPSVTQRQFIQHMRDIVRSVAIPDDSDLLAWRDDWDRVTGHSFDEALSGAGHELESMLAVAVDHKLDNADMLRQLGCFDPVTKGSGTACVAAAIGTFFRWPSSYQEGVIALVNSRGIDTDTIGAMYGSLCGAHIGSTRIPDRWCVQMQDYEYIIAVADALAKIALDRAIQNELVVDADLIERREENILDLTRTRAVSKHDRVMHPLLGPGWVQAVSEQRIRSGGEMLLADVVFDTGQSLRFRSFRRANGSAGTADT